MWKNRNYQTIQEIKQLFDEYILEEFNQFNSPVIQQLETALQYTNHTAFKIIHPLTIRGYKMASFRFGDTPIETIGVDIETNHKTGEPKLIGFYYPSGDYHALVNPDLESLFQIIINANQNVRNIHFVTWGNLDLQAIIRLFYPSEDERKQISRGISYSVNDDEIVAPVLRYLADGTAVFLAHYISGRSLKLGYKRPDYNREFISWIFNISQFYPGTIAQTARGLRLKWREFDRSTHLVDWSKYRYSRAYQSTVNGSNKQDARIVAELSDNLQQRFHNVFNCYPTLLVSMGSLTDAAVSKLLSEDKDEYKANSWRWLVANVWGDSKVIVEAETLLAEAYSAGYVDQYALGYFPAVYTADIAAAYPHKIRMLPDLRYSRIIPGEKNIDDQISRITTSGGIVETAIIRGKVTIPKSLRYHPITIKTYNRENYRPTGTFFASYTLEEREFCRKYGATFEDEEYVIIQLDDYKMAPIGLVSEKLGEFRNALISEMKKETDQDRKILLDGQQYIVKLIDNSIYGKTVMTTEIVESIKSKPTVTGYLAGDRFNLLYGALITARTRIQIAEACNAIAKNGGIPIMTMTDSMIHEVDVTRCTYG